MKYGSGVFSIESDIQGGLNSYNLVIKRLTGDCYKEIGSSPIDIRNSGNNRVYLEKGTYVARVISRVSNGEIQSNLIKFTISQPIEAIISQPGTMSVYTLDNSTQTRAANATSGNLVTNAKIYQKVGNQLIEKGYTDENGKLFAEFLPALQIGDKLIAEAEGYKLLEKSITQQMIDNNVINLQLDREFSAKIVNPQVQILNYKPIFTENMVTFHVSARRSDYRTFRYQALTLRKRRI